jgi:hypothetical protein
MRPVRRKKLALSLVIILSSAVQILVWYNFGTIQWVPDCGRLCIVSRVYPDNWGIPSSVLFAGANFTLVYVFDPALQGMTDMGVTLYFDVEFLGWTAHNVTISVGGWVPFSIFAALRTSTVEHDGRLFGVATANTLSLWNKWVFLVSI